MASSVREVGMIIRDGEPDTYVGTVTKGQLYWDSVSEQLHQAGDSGIGSAVAWTRVYLSTTP